MAGLDLKRSPLAASLVEKAIQERVKKDYWSHIEGLPSELQINGLLAVLVARKEDMAPLLEAWLTSDEAPVSWGKANGSLLERLKAPPDRQIYRQVSAEAIAFAVWLKRWAKALK